jgi:hypothetical protein
LTTLGRTWNAWPWSAWTVVCVLAAAAGCGSGAPRPSQGDAAGADHAGADHVTDHPGADAGADHPGADAGPPEDAAPDAGAWPDVAPGTVLACDQIPAEGQEALFAGAWVSLWMTPAPAPGPRPTGAFDADITGVLSVDVPVPPAGAIFEGALDRGASQRFAVEARDGRRLTVAYQVDYARVVRPLAAVLSALAGKEVSLRFVARPRPELSLAFVVADRDGLAFAFDAGWRGHTLAANDLGGLSVRPGRPWCSFRDGCPTFLSLQIAAATDVEIPPTEEGRFTFAGRSYAASNIRHNLPPPVCTDGGHWSAWALWRL